MPTLANARSRRRLRNAKRHQRRKASRKRAAVRKQTEVRELDELLDTKEPGWRSNVDPVTATNLRRLAIEMAEFDPLRARLEIKLHIKLDRFKQLRSGGVTYWLRPPRTAQFRLAKTGTGIFGNISALSTVAAAVCNGDTQQVREWYMHSSNGASWMVARAHLGLH